MFADGRGVIESNTTKTGLVVALIGVVNVFFPMFGWEHLVEPTSGLLGSLAVFLGAVGLRGIVGNFIAKKKED